ncbi:MAG: hypothetical protein PHX62_06260 [Bacilli bacterium]|nr:hypothetical protein [Bacilli bacterium]
MKKKFMSVPIKYEKSVIFEGDDIKFPVEILVMHDKQNLNKSNFEMEAIESAKESIKNIPILGYIKKIDGTDLKDFAGHEIELTFKDGEIKVTYLERPIGVIPETNSYEYVEIDGKTYVKVIGYIWKEYLNDGYEILQDNPNKSVSMEITVDDYEINSDGILDIKAYRYLGVTVLGDSVLPGMEGANMQVLGQFAESIKNDFYEKVESLNKELQENLLENKSQEFSDKGKEADIKTEINTDPKTEDQFNENTDVGIITNKNQIAFSATYNQKREALRNALDPIIVKDDEGNYISETYYYVVDFCDKYVMVEKSYWDANNYECTYGRFTYSFDESTLRATITSDFEKMVLAWLTEEENQKIQTERENMSAEFEQLKNRISEYESEISELTEYKNKYETEVNKHKQEQINMIISDFEETLGEVKEFKLIKENAINMEITVLEEKLYALVGKIKYSRNTKANISRVGVGTKETKKNNETFSEYGEAEKYFSEN